MSLPNRKKMICTECNFPIPDGTIAQIGNTPNITYVCGKCLHKYGGLENQNCRNYFINLHQDRLKSLSV